MLHDSSLSILCLNFLSSLLIFRNWVKGSPWQGFWRKLHWVNKQPDQGRELFIHNFWWNFLSFTLPMLTIQQLIIQIHRYRTKHSQQKLHFIRYRSVSNPKLWHFQEQNQLYNHYSSWHNERNRKYLRMFRLVWILQWQLILQIFRRQQRKT